MAKNPHKKSCHRYTAVSAPHLMPYPSLGGKRRHFIPASFTARRHRVQPKSISLIPPSFLVKVVLLAPKKKEQTDSGVALPSKSSLMNDDMFI